MQVACEPRSSRQHTPRSPLAREPLELPPLGRTLGQDPNRPQAEQVLLHRVQVLEQAEDVDPRTRQPPAQEHRREVQVYALLVHDQGQGTPLEAHGETLEDGTEGQTQLEQVFAVRQGFVR